MDIARKIGIGIVMIIPAFVGGGAVWDIFSSWIAVFIWIILMAIISGTVISGKLSGFSNLN